MARKNKKKPELVEVVSATEPEDVVSQLNAAVSGSHGLTGGPSLFSAAAAGRSDTMPCTKASTRGETRIIVQVVPS